MDTTIEHFNMCQKAKDIQKSWEFKRYDVFTTCYQMPDICIVDDFWLTLDENGKKITIDENWIWLPQQDNLQDMVSSDTVVNWRFYMFANDGLSIRLDPFKTMEQLWLAFVMHEKYGKHWDGSKWVIE